MERKRVSNWVFLAVNGLVFILFGLLVIFLNDVAIKNLLRYIGMGMLVLGAILLLLGINSIRRDKAGAMVLIEAIASVAIGIALLFFPEASVSLFLLMIGIWAIIIGVIQLVIVVNLGTALKSRNIALINGLLTIGIGISLLFNPFQWGIFLIKMIGVLAALFGIVLVWFAMMIKSLK
jgi:uncharacterized membrane protein HdeD (DUF308 family)